MLFCMHMIRSALQVGPPAILLGQAVFADASAVSVRSLTLLTFAALARHARLFSDLSTGSRSLLSGATFDVLASAIVLATLAITLRRRDHDLARFDALSRGWLLFAPSIFSLLVPVTQPFSIVAFTFDVLEATATYMTVGAWLPQLVLLDRLQLFKQNLPFIAFALAWLGHVFSAVFALVQRYSFVVESSTIPPILLADVVAALLYAEAVIGSPLLIEALADATDPGVSLDYHDEEKVDV